ncbi:MAG TPA: Maf family protein, partial [Plasticicumulans sp.]|nr:Maf family protein [Plasticicumulans sp.]
MSTVLRLASTSPRRRELLEQVGIGYTLIRAEVDETPLPAEPPADGVERLARAKAEAGLQ